MFKKLDSKFILEINSTVSVYSHDKTKARICTIENDDPNKVFSIAFRTPPIDNSGLTHILEHSVLCGSKKYPVKDPFVELLKGSVNTFLNAFTFPDKTMYPVASMNDKDFNNLMSVYLDAVFYPNIYDYEEIFKQEGWHYHLENENDPITINGVVYNEMKGAFSDPEQVLARCIMHSLYPDTCYGLESGGDPKFIPTLTYDSFKDFHSKYYHPSNSYIFLYGNCDMDERMSYIEQEYLNKFDYNEFDTTIKKQESFNETKYEEYYYPIDDNKDESSNYYLSYNVSIGDTLDIKKNIALDVLTEVLFSSTTGYVYDALIKADLCEDVDVTFENGIYQPFLSVSLIKSDKSKLDKFINVLENALRNVILDKEQIEASLKFREFKVREAKIDGPKGLLYQMNMLDSWLYNEAMPYHKLVVLDYFKELYDDINTNYFYDLIKECILDNKHKSIVILAPSKTIKKEDDLKLERSLDEYKKSLSSFEVSRLVKATKDLILYQDTPSSLEALDSLPKLSLEDLKTKPIKYNTSLIKNKYKTYYSNYFTNDIAYINLLFSMNDMDINTMCYTKLLFNLLRRISTKDNSYSDITKKIKLYTGGLGFQFKTLVDINNNINSYYMINISMIKDNINDAFDILYDVMFNTIFSEDKRIYDLLLELKNALEGSISNMGHQVALIRSLSHHDKASYIRDNTAGIGFLEFVYKVIDDYKIDKNIVINKLIDIYKNIINKNRFSLGITCDSNLYDSIINKIDVLYESFSNNDLFNNNNFELNNINEGFMTQYNVNYVAATSKFNGIHNGALLVLKNAISLDYLWFNVRVKGGAYGCMIHVDTSSNLGLTSYRDPNLENTINIYKALGEYVCNLDLNSDELLKFKIGAIAPFYDSSHVSTLGLRGIDKLITGFDYEYSKNLLNEIINTSLEDLKSFGPIFKDALDNLNICVIGFNEDINRNKDLFDETKNLLK